ncbi:MAG: hypothetical protein RMY34_12600 [Aulosira sp. DedQUE10]|nr:hypothetical protein [Aulosira sp. DedQUE10]
MRFTHILRWFLVSNLTCLTLTTFNSATAQITSDNTLGTEGSVVTPETIKEIPSERIDGGAIRGGNLFHSFTQFNSGNGGSGGAIALTTTGGNICGLAYGSNM